MYEAKVRTGPIQPKFSVLRLMAIEWRRRVFGKMESVLLENALELLKTVREDNFERILKCQNRKRYGFEDDNRTLTLMKYPPL